MHTKDSMELNFEGLEKQKLYTNVMQNEISQSDIAQNEMRYSLDEKKVGYLFSYHVYSRSYDH